MFYALNLFDLKDEAVYRKYLTTAGPIVQELGGDLVVMGRRTPDVPVNFPGTTIGGGQRGGASSPLIRPRKTFAGFGLIRRTTTISI